MVGILRRIKRNPHLFLMGFFSIFFTQLIVNVFIVGYLELEKMGTFSSEAFTIKAYFLSAVPAERIEQVMGDIRELPETRQVVLVSSEEARSRFLEYFDLREEDFPPEDNPFPRSLEVTSQRVEDVPLLAEQIKETEAFEEVIYGGGNVELFLDFYRMVLGVGGLILLGIFIFSLVVIINVIRISIHNQEEEIRVSSLIGATDRFIRRPFLLEGFYQGFSAGLCSFVLSYIVLRYSLNFLDIAFPFFPWISLEETIWPMVIANSGLGGTIGFLGSYLATGSALRRSQP